MADAWPRVRLANLIEAGRAITYGIVQPGTHEAEGIPIVRVNNVRDGRVLTEDVLRVSHVIESKYGRTRLRGGEVLLTLVGTVGEVAIVPPELAGWNLARAVATIPVDPSVGWELVALWLRSREAQHHLRTRATTTVQATLNLRDVEEIPIALPPAPVRAAIVEIAGALDGRMSVAREMNRTLESIARALFRSWFVDFDPVRAKIEGRSTGLPHDVAALFPDRLVDSPLGPIPEGWHVAPLSEWVDVLDCSHAKKPERQPAGRVLLQLNNIRNDGLMDLADQFLIDDADYAAWTKRMEAREGDCVITNVGRVGAVAQLPPATQAALGRNMTGLRPKQPYPTYLIEALLSEAMQQEIRLRTDAGTILDALNVRSIPKLRTVLAPTKIMVAFEFSCRPLRQRMELNLGQNLTLARLRDALLPQLLSGAIRIPALAEEVPA